jgi:membrane protein YdbS with pleckstrin-like domain
MPLLINKDGKQLGPYSLDEARALVLSGKLEADDWAWPDGATDWVALKDVPGFAQTAAAKPPVPGAALEEHELWRGHPSQILNLNIYLCWVIILGLAFFIVEMVGVAYSVLWSAVGFGVLVLVALVHGCLLYFHLRAVEYVITTQRVRVISGIFSKDIQEIELFRVKDTMAHQSFFLRLFGLGTITVISGDERHPQLVMTAIPKAIELRERLRQEVMALRQRFGVRELDVM